MRCTTISHLVTKGLADCCRKASAAIPDVFIDDMKGDRVTEYKYLGTVLDNKLKFNKNTDFIHKRCHPRIFRLQKLRSLIVLMSVLLFYALSTGVVVNQFLTFSFLCWFGGLNVNSKNVLNKVVNVCGKVVGKRTIKSVV